MLLPHHLTKQTLLDEDRAGSGLLPVQLSRTQSSYTKGPPQANDNRQLKSSQNLTGMISGMQWDMKGASELSTMMTHCKSQNVTTLLVHHRDFDSAKPNVFTLLGEDM